MGFDPTMARNALDAVGWNVESAIALLLSDGDISGSANNIIGNTVSNPPQVLASSGERGKKKLRFKVPDNVKPGQTVTIAEKPGGRKYAVKVPPHAKPGSTLQIFV